MTTLTPKCISICSFGSLVQNGYFPTTTRQLTSQQLVLTEPLKDGVLVLHKYSREGPWIFLPMNNNSP